jgi:hypothetical protein
LFFLFSEQAPFCNQETEIAIEAMMMMRMIMMINAMAI